MRWFSCFFCLFLLAIEFKQILVGFLGLFFFWKILVSVLKLLVSEINSRVTVEASLWTVTEWSLAFHVTVMVAMVRLWSERKLREIYNLVSPKWAKSSHHRSGMNWPILRVTAFLMCKPLILYTQFFCIYVELLIFPSLILTATLNHCILSLSMDTLLSPKFCAINNTTKCSKIFLI